MHGTGSQLASKRRKTRLVNERTPAGRISRSLHGEREFPPTQVRRMLDAAMGGLRDAEWGTEMGRLLLQNSITSGMYAAGKKWAELANKYQSAIGVFPVRSSSMERGSLSSPPDPDSDDGRKIAEREANNAERFFEAHAILTSAGHLPLTTVRRLCEYNESPVGFGELIAVRIGLLRLVSHWGLTNEGKSANPDR